MNPIAVIALPRLLLAIGAGVGQQTADPNAEERLHLQVIFHVVSDSPDRALTRETAQRLLPHPESSAIGTNATRLRIVAIPGPDLTR
jgi:hypothetical protein